jgi:hypothetical protein
VQIVLDIVVSLPSGSSSTLLDGCRIVSCQFKNPGSDYFLLKVRHMPTFKSETTITVKKCGIRRKTEAVYLCRIFYATL